MASSASSQTNLFTRIPIPLDLGLNTADTVHSELARLFGYKLILHLKDEILFPTGQTSLTIELGLGMTRSALAFYTNGFSDWFRTNRSATSSFKIVFTVITTTKIVSLYPVPNGARINEKQPIGPHISLPTGSDGRLSEVRKLTAPPAYSAGPTPPAVHPTSTRSESDSSSDDDDPMDTFIQNVNFDKFTPDVLHRYFSTRDEPSPRRFHSINGNNGDAIATLRLFRALYKSPQRNIFHHFELLFNDCSDYLRIEPPHAFESYWPLRYSNEFEQQTGFLTVLLLQHDADEIELIKQKKHDTCTLLAMCPFFLQSIGITGLDLTDDILFIVKFVLLDDFLSLFYSKIDCPISHKLSKLKTSCTEQEPKPDSTSEQ